MNLDEIVNELKSVSKISFKLVRPGSFMKSHTTIKNPKQIEIKLFSYKIITNLKNLRRSFIFEIMMQALWRVLCHFQHDIYFQYDFHK